MDPITANQLLKLNQQFYHSHARSFSATRRRVQSGVKQIVDRFILQSQNPPARLLDLGCGNGELSRHLIRSGYKGSYIGIDFSVRLLADTETLPVTSGFFPQFLQLDITSSDWSSRLRHQPFDLIVCFAVLHHIPGDELRLRVLSEVNGLLAPNGKLIISNWQFLGNERMRKHILPWQTVQIPEGTFDEGDALLDWRAEENPAGSTPITAVRYAHHYTQEELHTLAKKSGFTIDESWLSDGKEGNLSLYQVWTMVTARK